MTRAAFLLALLTLAACGPRPDAQALATSDYCHAAANRVFDRQHRELLSEEDQSTTPYSSTGMPSSPSDGLSDRYIYENRVDDCVARRTAATEDGTTFGPQNPAVSPTSK
jgi:hypothetical protein